MLRLIVQNQANGTLAHFGEYLFVVLLMMLPPTQELEPPANPARFKSAAPGFSDRAAVPDFGGCFRSSRPASPPYRGTPKPFDSRPSAGTIPACGL